MSKRRTAKETLALYADKAEIDRHGPALYPAILEAVQRYGAQAFQAGLNKGLSMRDAHLVSCANQHDGPAVPEKAEKSGAYTPPLAIRLLLRILFTPAVFLLFGAVGVARQWRWGGKFEINEKENG